MNVTTESLSAGDANFNMAGQVVSRNLDATVCDMTNSLVNRLIKYASKRMVEAGLPVFKDVRVTKITDSFVYYSVAFISKKKCEIVLNGITTNHRGWPDMDYGFAINE